MSLEENKRLARRQFEELINNKNLAVIDTDMAEDFVDHDGAPDLPPGPAGIRAWITHVHQVVPDLRVTIESIVAEGDLVAMRNTWQGTPAATFLGIPHSGRSFTLKGMVMWRVRDGKLAERWATLDLLGLDRQLRG